MNVYEGIWNMWDKSPFPSLSSFLSLPLSLSLSLLSIHPPRLLSLSVSLLAPPPYPSLPLSFLPSPLSLSLALSSLLSHPLPTLALSLLSPCPSFSSPLPLPLLHPPFLRVPDWVWSQTKLFSFKLSLLCGLKLSYLFVLNLVIFISKISYFGFELSYFWFKTKLFGLKPGSN